MSRAVMARARWALSPIRMAGSGQRWRAAGWTVEVWRLPVAVAGRRRGMVVGEDGVDFVGHCCAEFFQQCADLHGVPGVGGDGVGDREQRLRETVASGLVAGEWGCRVAVVTCDRGGDGASEQFGVAQRVGEAVGGDGVFVVAGVADQGPARPGGATEVAGTSGEATERPGGGCIGEPASSGAAAARRCRNPVAVWGRRPSARRVSPSRRRRRLSARGRPPGARTGRGR